MVINDAGDGDTDGDGLGDGLEGTYGLTTCPDSTTVLSSVDCGLIADPGDTDSDGIGDYEEAIGKDDEFDPLELYRWGANPKHKDIIVEVDRQNYVGSTNYTAILTEETLALAASHYADLANISNPDSQPGIALHFDVARNSYRP